MLIATVTSAQVEESGAAISAAELEAEMATTVPVELDGNRLFWVRGISSYPAEQRAERIKDRIKALARNPDFRADGLRLVESDLGIKIMAGNQLVMTVFDADARIEDVRRPVLATYNLERIRQAIADYRQARNPDTLLREGLFSLGGTVVLVVIIALLLWLGRRTDEWIARRVQHRIGSLGIQSFEIVRAERIGSAVRRVVYVIRILLVLLAVFVYLDFVLARFPWTRTVANRLFDWVTGPLVTMGQGIIAVIPNLIFLTILFYVSRFILRLIRLFFDAVARGTVTLAGFEADWAVPTYKIAWFAVVAFALIVAYPYIPGSHSDAFKGISIFLGVVFSLGSSSAIANVIAGYLMTYRRAFKAGDRVRIGDVTGDVIEMRLQATHVRTLKNEEAILPNSQLLNGHVVNYSSLATRYGLILHTTVGIGYETPWRQVEAMLLVAAERTPGLLREPPPFVLQQSLGDFAVNYELNAYCGDARNMLPLYTALHRNILDVFNEYGVQIMTPAYRADTPEPKRVPREQWYAAPAAREPEGDKKTPLPQEEGLGVRAGKAEGFNKTPLSPS
ncbi:MAG: mechanosensitive ion channel family protein [Candidatus Contendobacter sp.]|nr:MAG: mechanosensitive ion channel family protein [Candidatus Contendobacter sp.]